MNIYTRTYEISGQKFVWVSLDEHYWWPALSTEEMEEDMGELRKELAVDPDFSSIFGKGWTPESDQE